MTKREERLTKELSICKKVIKEIKDATEIGDEGYPYHIGMIKSIIDLHERGRCFYVEECKA